ncbi:MAG: S8 family serine peptidase [Schleiferiaceae bacterium]|nr:S8 family serine peptidase [Schleiferiaceae bacterium]
MNKQLFFALALLIFSLSLDAQEATKYWVFFADKPLHQKMMQNPEALLSKKALERRKRHNIEIDPFDVPVSATYVEQLEQLGITTHRQSRWLNAISAFLNDEQLATLKLLPFVTEIRPVATLKIQKDLIDYTPLATAANNLSRSKVQFFDYGSTEEQIAIHKGQILHEFGFTGEGMTIAICDGGFNGAGPTGVFSELHLNGNIVFTQDFVQGGPNVYRAGTHGTRVLSTMAFQSNGFFVGTAPNAKYILFRTENESTETTQEEDNWVAAAELADSLGADMINTSLGYTTFDNGIGDYTYEDMDGQTAIITRGAVMAARKGLLLCVSAGNYGSLPWQFISAPADADSVLTVGAVSVMGVPAPFSSIGPTADGRIKPNVVSVGVATAVISGPNGVQRNNGTSFSSPNLCGLVACLWQAFPEKNNIEILKMVERSSDQFENPDFKVGFGIPDFAYALFEDTLNLNFPEKGILTFPTPFSESIFVRYQEQDNVFIERARLYGIGGNNIFEWETVRMGKNSFELTVDPALSNGIYLLQIRFSNGEVFTNRVIKN